jgi:hypothetical protein
MMCDALLLMSCKGHDFEASTARNRTQSAKADPAQLVPLVRVH